MKPKCKAWLDVDHRKRTVFCTSPELITKIVPLHDNRLVHVWLTYYGVNSNRELSSDYDTVLLSENKKLKYAWENPVMHVPNIWRKKIDGSYILYIASLWLKVFKWAFGYDHSMFFLYKKIVGLNLPLTTTIALVTQFNK